MQEVQRLHKVLLDAKKANLISVYNAVDNDARNFDEVCRGTLLGNLVATFSQQPFGMLFKQPFEQLFEQPFEQPFGNNLLATVLLIAGRAAAGADAVDDQPAEGHPAAEAEQVRRLVCGPPIFPGTVLPRARPSQTVPVLPCRTGKQ